MKFKFKIQQYQTDAVNSITKVFDGQPYLDKVKYTRDLGIIKKSAQDSFFDMPNSGYERDDIGFENAKIVLEDEILLKNIHALQSQITLNYLADLLIIWGGVV